MAKNTLNRRRPLIRKGAHIGWRALDRVITVTVEVKLLFLFLRRSAHGA